MFPNMRLLIGALLASVVVLCGVFAVFAAFRVSHEPLNRLPADTVALQLVARESAGPPPAWQAASAFAAGESLAKVQAGRAVADAPRPLPVSRVTIRPSDLTAISTVRPVAMIDTPQATMPPQRESQSLALRAAASATAPNATARGQAEPPTPINNRLATTASAAPNNKIAVAEPISAAQTKPAQSAAEPNAAGETAEAVSAPAPTVAAIEPAANPISPGTRPEATNALPEAAVPEPKPRPKLIAKMEQRALRKAAERRRIAARKRAAPGVPGSSVAQIGYQNSAYGNPFFQSAPGAFQHRPGRNRAAPSNSATPAHNSIAGNLSNWSSSQ